MLIRFEKIQSRLGAGQTRDHGVAHRCGEGRDRRFSVAARAQEGDPPPFDVDPCGVKEKTPMPEQDFGKGEAEEAFEPVDRAGGEDRGQTARPIQAGRNKGIAIEAQPAPPPISESPGGRGCSAGGSGASPKPDLEIRGIAGRSFGPIGNRISFDKEAEAGHGAEFDRQGS